LDPPEHNRCAHIQAFYRTLEERQTWLGFPKKLAGAKKDDGSHRQRHRSHDKGPDQGLICRFAHANNSLR
jgi:hypothetical protein